MNRRLHLIVVIGEAVLLFTLGYFALDLLAGGLFGGLHTEILLWTVILVPISAATWWMFRKLKQIYSRREAIAAAITFVVFTPISVLVATPFATLPGNAAAGLLGKPFGLVGAFSGLVVLIGVLVLIPTTLAIWIAGHFKTTGQLRQRS